MDNMYFNPILFLTVQPDQVSYISLFPDSRLSPQLLLSTILPYSQVHIFSLSHLKIMRYRMCEYLLSWDSIYEELHFHQISSYRAFSQMDKNNCCKWITFRQLLDDRIFCRIVSKGYKYFNLLPPISSLVKEQKQSQKEWQKPTKLRLIRLVLKTLRLIV